MGRANDDQIVAVFIDEGHHGVGDIVARLNMKLYPGVVGQYISGGRFKDRLLIGQIRIRADDA